MIALGGGCTSQQAEGNWINPLGGLATEEVTVLEMYSPSELSPDNLRQVVNIILEGLNQDAVAVIVGDEMLQFERRP